MCASGAIRVLCVFQLIQNRQYLPESSHKVRGAAFVHLNKNDLDLVETLIGCLARNQEMDSVDHRTNLGYYFQIDSLGNSPRLIFFGIGGFLFVRIGTGRAFCESFWPGEGRDLGVGRALGPSVLGELALASLVGLHRGL